MGFRGLTLTLAALLVLKGYSASGQYFGTASEFINPGLVQSFAAPAALACAAAGPAAPAGQFVIPAIIKPIFQSDPYPLPAAPTVPSFGGFPPAMPPPFPPIIIADDGGDNWHQLLYFLLFAMNKRNNGGCGYGGCGGGCYNNCGCGGGYGYGGCNSGCGGCYGGCNNGYGGCYGGCNSGCGGGYGGGCGCGYGYDSYGDVYGGGCGCNSGCSNSCGPYAIPYSYGAPIGAYPVSEDVTIIQTPAIQACNGPSPNEVNLIIRTDPCGCA